MKRRKGIPTFACAFTAMALAAGGGSTAVVAAKKKASEPQKTTAAEQAAVSSGLLTQQEAKLGCKRMAGQMQIRILESRGSGPKRKGSGVAQGLQSAIVPLVGGTQRGADATSDATRDVARLKAMNEILISRNCPYYDLEAELKLDQSARTPSLIRAKRQGSKKKP